jgi:hypothetical protein
VGLEAGASCWSVKVSGRPVLAQGKLGVDAFRATFKISGVE